MAPPQRALRATDRSFITASPALLRRFPLNVRAVSAKIKIPKKTLAALSHFENR